MSDINVQLKNRNGAIWDQLFPVTKAALVITDANNPEPHSIWFDIQ